MALRWTAAGMLEAKKGFRRIKAYPLCQGSCPLLYFSSNSEVGGMG